MYILFLQTCWIATVFSLEFNVRTILHFFCTNTRTNDMFKKWLELQAEGNKCGIQDGNSKQSSAQ